MPIFTHCNVCGRELRGHVEDRMGMCSRCADNSEPDDDYDDEDESESEWDESLDECGMLPPHLGGGCTLAGTEHCDFDCPFRD